MLLQGRKTKNLNRAVWLGTICVLVVMLVSHTYNDILITTRHGIDFWDILENRQLLDFYSVNMIRYPWVYFGNTLKPMVWPHILEGTGIDLGYGDSFVYYVACQLYGHPEIQAMINAVFLASLAAVAYTTYPGKSSTSLQKWPAHKQLNDVLAVRFLANAFVCLLPIIGIFI